MKDRVSPKALTEEAELERGEMSIIFSKRRGYCNSPETRRKISESSLVVRFPLVLEEASYGVNG